MIYKEMEQEFGDEKTKNCEKIGMKSTDQNDMVILRT